MDRQLQQHASSMIKGANTPATQLRQYINQIEINLGKLQISDVSELENIPTLFDQTAHLLDTLEEGGANIASEYARFDTVSASFRKNSRQYIKALGGRRAYVDLRQRNTPDQDHWWWFLDEYLDNQLRNRQKKAIRSLLISLGVFAILTLLYVVFLRPDKETRQIISYQNDAERALSDGAPQQALEFLEQALAIRHEDDRLLILHGVAAQLTDNEDLAEDSFSKAREIIDDEVNFLATRAQVYLGAGLPEYTLQDAEQAILINPESAIAHYQKGLAANALGDTQTAFLSLETAAKFAHEEGHIELEGMARIQMAYLSQNIVFPQATQTPEN